MISPAPVSHNKLNGLKERALFKAKSNYHIALMDLEAYYFNKKKKPVKILSGEKVEILKKGTWDYKLKYNDQKLFVKRQHYFPSLEQE